MNFIHSIRKIATTLVLVFILSFTTACAGASQATQPRTLPAADSSLLAYQQLERGNSPAGQEFGNWVVQTANGLIKDAYVRDSNKLGVVISPKVRPNEVRDLSRSLLQGFHKNFPNQDLTVLVYAPDKQLILTAKYDEQSKQIQYQGA